MGSNISLHPSIGLSGHAEWTPGAALCVVAEKHGFVVLDDFVGHPLIEVMARQARRIARECNDDYPQDVHRFGYIHRGVENDTTSAIRGIYHPKFRSPCFADFFSCPAMLEFTHEWTGLRPGQLAFGSCPLIFCSGNSVPARRRLSESWVAGGGGWHRDGRWWGGDDSQMMFNHQSDEPPRDYSLEAEKVPPTAAAMCPSHWACKRVSRPSRRSHPPSPSLSRVCSVCRRAGRSGPPRRAHASLSTTVPCVQGRSRARPSSWRSSTTSVTS
jgi:hypothetical protein